MVSLVCAKIFIKTIAIYMSMPIMSCHAMSCHVMATNVFCFSTIKYLRTDDVCNLYDSESAANNAMAAEESFMDCLTTILLLVVTVFCRDLWEFPT